MAKRNVRGTIVYRHRDSEADEEEPMEIDDFNEAVGGEGASRDNAENVELNNNDLVTADDQNFTIPAFGNKLQPINMSTKIVVNMKDENMAIGQVLTGPDKGQANLQLWDVIMPSGEIQLVELNGKVTLKTLNERLGAACGVGSYQVGEMTFGNFAPLSQHLTVNSLMDHEPAVKLAIGRGMTV